MRRWKPHRASLPLFPLKEKTSGHKRILEIFREYPERVKENPHYVPPMVEVLAMCQSKDGKKDVDQFFSFQRLLKQYKKRKRWKPFTESERSKTK